MYTNNKYTQTGDGKYYKQYKPAVGHSGSIAVNAERIILSF